MFRPVRTLITMAVVFLAGVFFERHNQAERCMEAHGKLQAGICKEGPE